jgi:hypothetical protein
MSGRPRLAAIVRANWADGKRRRAQAYAGSAATSGDFDALLAAVEDERPTLVLSEQAQSAGC